MHFPSFLRWGARDGCQARGEENMSHCSLTRGQLTIVVMIGQPMLNVLRRQGWSDAGGGHVGILRELGPLQERRAHQAVSVLCPELCGSLPPRAVVHTSFLCVWLCFVFVTCEQGDMLLRGVLC